MIFVIIIIIALVLALIGALSANSKEEARAAAFFNGVGCLYYACWIGLTIAIIVALASACS